MFGINKLKEKVSDLQLKQKVIEKSLSKQIWMLQNPPKFEYGDYVIDRRDNHEMKVLSSEVRLDGYSIVLRYYRLYTLDDLESEQITTAKEYELKRKEKK